MKLAGRNAIITGANRGFGFEIAKKFVEEGASVAICGRDARQVERAVDALRKHSLPQQTITGLPLDVSKEENVKQMINTAINVFGRIDIVVNNAGIYGPKGLIEDVSSEEWVDAIHINLLSVFFMCKGVLPHMHRTR